MQWAWVNGGEQRAYEYDYDKLGMLRNADMHEKLPEFKNHYEQYGNFAERNITYDLNGNILTLTRSTGPSVENSGNPSPTAVDNLTYAYTGNQLSTLDHNNASGSVAESGKFGYSYDKNGNMISDARKYATFRFNYLNLLQQAKFYADKPDGGSKLIQSANYTYLADGTKASVVDKDGNGYSYLGSLTYKRSADGSLKLESATHGSGRIVVRDDPESSDNSGDNGNSGNPNAPTKRIYENQYYITDHLGSVRVVFNQKGEVLARNDYYPFGKQHDNPALTAATTSGTSTNPADNRYLYNGKEKQVTGALDFLDYGWRMYDSEGCRWLSPDPKAEKYNWWSPYNYAINNPIRFIDPDGKDIVLPGSKEAQNTHLKMLYASTGNNYQLDENNKLSLVGVDKNFSGTKSEMLINTIQSGIDSKEVYTINLVGANGDDQNVFIDSYSGMQIDVSDLAKLGKTSTALQGAAIGHFLNEVQIDGTFETAHASSLQVEGKIFGELVGDKSIISRRDYSTNAPSGNYQNVIYEYNSANKFELKQGATSTTMGTGQFFGPVEITETRVVLNGKLKSVKKVK